jgi:hypothetical protein
MERDELRRAEALDRYWDEVVLGERPAGAEPPEADLAELIEDLDALGDPPRPGRARERVWRELRRHPRWRDPSLNGNFPTQTSIGQPLPATNLDDGGGDRVTPVAVSRTRVARPRWVVAQLATAALLLLTLVAGLLLLRVVRPQWAGPLSEPLVETLLDQTVEVGGTPGSWVPVAVERWTFQPGAATLASPALAGPQWVAADGGTLVATVGGVEQPLEPGSALFVPAGEEFALRNAGAGEAAAIRCVATAGFSFEEFDRAVISRQTVLDTVATKALPAGASRVVFVRLTLPPGDALPPDATRELDWFGVVDGRLGLTLHGETLPVGWKSGVEQEVPALDRLPRLIPGTEVTLRNLGDEPLVVLRLTVLPVDQVTGDTDDSAALPAAADIARDAVAGEVADGSD